MEYHIVISGTIGSWWDSCSADYVRYVLNKNKGKDVHVGFCSLGGYVKDGLEMNQAFKDHGNVHAHAFGMNASISTIAMLGCKSIDIVKGSFFLIHNVSTTVFEWEQANKEQIDEMIKKLQKSRADLKTFDDVLASMYAEKTGKTFEECQQQMKKGNWMTAQEAVDFGLVDSIRDDEDAEKAAKEITDNFVNSYSYINIFKDAGIPPLTQPQQGDNITLAQVVDVDGNPTETFLQKTWQGVKALFRNQHAGKSEEMKIKIFVNLMALLAMADGFETDDSGNTSLSQEQMKKVDDRLGELTKTEKDNQEAMKAAADALKKAKDEIAELKKLNEQQKSRIENLEGSAGDETNTAIEENGKENFTAKDLWNTIKD